MSSTNTANNQVPQSVKERVSEQLIDLSNLFDIGDKIAIFLQRTSVKQQILYLIGFWRECYIKYYKKC